MAPLPTLKAWSRIKRVVRYHPGKARAGCLYQWQSLAVNGIGFSDYGKATDKGTRISVAGKGVCRGSYVIKHWAT